MQRNISARPLSVMAKIRASLLLRHALCQRGRATDERLAKIKKGGGINRAGSEIRGRLPLLGYARRSGEPAKGRSVMGGN